MIRGHSARGFKSDPIPSVGDESMPIFEFRCRKCQARFEVLFRSRDEKLSVDCPECGSKKVQRQMSAFSGKIGNTTAGGNSCGSCAATHCSTCGHH